MVSPADNVATCLEDVEAGATVRVRLGDDVRNIKAGERIPFGFKIALSRIAKGAQVIKYGESIGVASRDIAPGDLVHVHNIEGTRGRGDLAKELS